MTDTSETYPRLMNISQTASFLGISKHTLYRDLENLQKNEGFPQGVLTGRTKHRRFDRQAVEDWLDSKNPFRKPKMAEDTRISDAEAEAIASARAIRDQRRK